MLEALSFASKMSFFSDGNAFGTKTDQCTRHPVEPASIEVVEGFF